VSELLSLPRDAWAAVAAGDRRLRQSAVVELLLDHAAEVFSDDPFRCRDITAVAARLAELTDGATAELRVRAWKDHANITSSLGEHANAIRLLETADAAAGSAADPEYQHAIVTFARSIALCRQERMAEAHAELVSARAVFERADRRRYILTFHQEAILKAGSGDPRAAAEMVMEVIRDVATWNDEPELAMLYTVAAYALGRANEFERAVEYVEKASEIHRKLGNRAEMVRDMQRHAAGMAALHRWDAAFAEYAEARAKMLEMGLKTDLLFLDLSQLRAKAAFGADARELHSLATQVANDALAAGLPMTACEATDWLRQISERVTPDAVEMVTNFLRKVELNPSLEFRPPDA
jgi:hypothetical protein